MSAKLWYQPLGFRWVRNLEEYEAAESKRFLSMYDAMPKASTAILLAEDMVTIAPETANELPPEDSGSSETGVQ